MPIDFQEDTEASAAAPAPATIEFQPEPDYMARIGPAMRQVMGEWGVSLAQPGGGLSEGDAATLNRTIALKVRKEAEKRLEEGAFKKVARGTRQSAISLAESMRDPQTLGLIALSSVAPEVGFGIFAGMGAKQIGETAGTLNAPGATTTEEKTQQVLAASLMALPIVGAKFKAIENYRAGVANAAEEAAFGQASKTAAFMEATRASLPAIDFVEEGSKAGEPAPAPGYRFPPEAAFFESAPAAYASKALPEVLGGVFRSADGTIGRLTRTPDGRFALDDGQGLVELSGGPEQTVGDLGLRAVSLGQAGAATVVTGQYPAQPMPVLSRLQTSRNVAAFRKLSQTADATARPAAEPMATAQDQPPIPGLYPAHAALIDAVTKTAADKEAPLEQLYGALEAAPTARRVLEGTIRQMEQAGATKEQTDPLYQKLGAIEGFENTYLDSSGTRKARLEPPTPAAETTAAGPAKPVARPAGPALPPEKGASDATKEGQQPPDVPPQPESGDRGGPATRPGPGHRLQPAAPGAGESTEPSAEVESTTVIDPRDVRASEVPLKDIRLSTDVPNFKEGASSTTGVVPGQELSGKFERLGTAPIVLWRRLDGSLEVITGRHRLDLARRSGEETIPAQVVDESRGFTKDMALVFDAESNIRDGQGSVQDYAHYFRNTQITEAEARSRGLLSRAKGNSGFDLGKHAADDLYALYTAGKITEAQALAATRAAPGNAAGQRIGTRFALEGQSPEFISNVVKVAMAESKGLAQNLDLFGQDDSAMRAMAEQARRAAKIQAGLREQIQAVSGAAKKPEVARQMGVNIDDPEAVRAKVADLKAQLARWETWPMQPDLVAQTKGEAPKPVPQPAAEPPPGSAPAATTAGGPKLRSMEQAGELFQGADAPFNLAGETAPDPERIGREKEAADRAREEAAAIAAREQQTLPGTATNPLIDKIKALIDPATGNLTRGGDVVRQIVADHPTDQVVEFMRWARRSPESTPFVARFAVANAADVLRERGVPVDSTEWQQATLGAQNRGRVEAAGTSAPVAAAQSPHLPRPPTSRPLRSLPRSIGVPAAVTGPAPPAGPIRTWFAQRLRGFRSVFSPASIDRPAAYVAGVMREMIGRGANALSQADEAMKSLQRRVRSHTGPGRLQLQSERAAAAQLRRHRCAGAQPRRAAGALPGPGRYLRRRVRLAHRGDP